MSERALGAIKLSDVAREAGISISTVSRVLNNQPGISSATRRSVVDVARSMGYQVDVDLGAAAAREKALRVEVVICPLVEQKNPMGIAYYGVTMEGIRSAADPANVHVKLTIHSPEADETPLAANTSGVLVVGIPPKPLLRRLHEAGVPYVTLANNRPDGFVGDMVTSDKFAESLWLCDHLVERGMKRIGLLLPGIDGVMREGFCFGMARRGLPIRPSDIHMTASTDLATFVPPLHGMLESGDLPDALVLASYSAADFCVEMLGVKGIRVPDDLLLVAFCDDDCPNNPNYITARYDTKEMGRLALERLLGRIREPDRKHHMLVVPTTLYELRNRMIRR